MEQPQWERLRETDSQPRSSGIRLRVEDGGLGQSRGACPLLLRVCPEILPGSKEPSRRHQGSGCCSEGAFWEQEEKAFSQTGLRCPSPAQPAWLERRRPCSWGRRAGFPQGSSGVVACPGSIHMPWRPRGCGAPGCPALLVPRVCRAGLLGPRLPTSLCSVHRGTLAACPATSLPSTGLPQWIDTIKKQGSRDVVALAVPGGVVVVRTLTLRCTAAPSQSGDRSGSRCPCPSLDRCVPRWVPKPCHEASSRAAPSQLLLGLSRHLGFLLGPLSLLLAPGVIRNSFQRALHT